MKTNFKYFILPYFDKQRQVNLEIFNLFAAVWPDTANKKRLKIQVIYYTENNGFHADLSNMQLFNKHIFSFYFLFNNLNAQFLY